MERLTRLVFGKRGPNWAVANLEHDSQEILDRLAAYEDTCLTPEEIYQHRFLIAALKDPEKLARLRDIVLADEAGRLVVLPFSGYSISEKALCQLAKADHEGRLIVVPCKIGDLLYEVDLPEYGVITCKVLSISYYDGPRFHVPGNEVVSSLTVEVEVIEGHGKGSSYTFEVEDFGKTVFLTRQEAEEALREEGQDG